MEGVLSGTEGRRREGSELENGVWEEIGRGKKGGDGRRRAGMGATVAEVVDGRRVGFVIQWRRLLVVSVVHQHQGRPAAQLRHILRRPRPALCLNLSAIVPLFPSSAKSLPRT